MRDNIIVGLIINESIVNTNDELGWGGILSRASSDHSGVMSSRSVDIINMNFNNVNVPLSIVQMSPAGLTASTCPSPWLLIKLNKKSIKNSYTMHYATKQWQQTVLNKNQPGGAGYWPLIGPEWSRDLDTGLSLVQEGPGAGSNEVVMLINFLQTNSSSQKVRRIFILVWITTPNNL